MKETHRGTGQPILGNEGIREKKDPTRQENRKRNKEMEERHNRKRDNIDQKKITKKKRGV